MRKPSNPFIISGYHSPRYFCDRTQETAWLIDQFENERNAVIYSWRRMGKTALIRHFFYALEKNNQAECVFIDLLGTANQAEANKRLASAVINRFGDLKKEMKPPLRKLIGSLGATIGFDPLSGTPQVTFGMLPGQSVKTKFEVIGGFLAERKKPVVICIDEFQQVVHYPESNSEAVFRSWMQDYPMIRFIFCGSHRQMMTSMFSEKTRPFYRSAQLYSLEPLSEEEYMSFIHSNFKKGGKIIKAEHIDRIFSWTRRQTYYVQLACNKLFGKKDNVTGEAVSEVFSEILQQEIPLFSSYQNLLTHFQWKLLIAIAREEKTENPMAQHFLNKYDLGAASSVSSALQTLMKKEFIIREGDSYLLHDTLLMRWLQQL